MADPSDSVNPPVGSQPPERTPVSPDGPSPESIGAGTKFEFVLGVCLGLVPWGLGLIGITVNLWLGCAVLSACFVLIAHAFLKWAASKNWSNWLRVGIVLIAGVAFIVLIGNQVASQYHHDSRASVSVSSSPSSSPSPLPFSPLPALNPTVQPTPTIEPRFTRPLPGSSGVDTKTLTRVQPEKSTGQETATASSSPLATAQPSEQPHLPVERITTSSEVIPSRYEQFPFGLRLIIQTNVTISPVHFVVVCSGPIGSHSAYPVGSGVLTSPSRVLSEDKTQLAFSWQSPPFPPERPIAVYLYSETRIKVVRVVRLN